MNQMMSELNKARRRLLRECYEPVRAELGRRQLEALRCDERWENIALYQAEPETYELIPGVVLPLKTEVAIEMILGMAVERHDVDDRFVVVGKGAGGHLSLTVGYPEYPYRIEIRNTDSPGIWLYGQNGEPR